MGMARIILQSLMCPIFANDLYKIILKYKEIDFLDNRKHNTVNMEDNRCSYKNNKEGMMYFELSINLSVFDFL